MIIWRALYQVFLIIGLIIPDLFLYIAICHLVLYTLFSFEIVKCSVTSFINSDDISDNISDNISDDISDDNSDDISDDNSDNISDDISDDINDNNSDSDSDDNSNIKKTGNPNYCFPYEINDFVIYSETGVTNVEKFYTWLNDTSNDSEVSSNQRNKTPIIDFNMRNQLEELLHSVYKQNCMWSILSNTTTKSSGYTPPPCFDKYDHTNNTSQTSNADASTVTNSYHQAIADQWMRLIEITFVEIVKTDLNIIEQLHTREHKAAFVVNTFIPLLIKYKDIYSSSTIFKFGPPDRFYKTIIRKMLEFITVNGMIEAMILIACIYPDVINDDWHPSINTNSTINTSILILKHHKLYGPFVHKLPLRVTSCYQKNV